jgi:hypothetical protein
MKVTKKTIAKMSLCYAVTMFSGSDRESFLVATEKAGPCVRFALDGTPIETVWEGPGGVMTMVQVPGRGNQFLSTQEFYSPNCGGDDARIVSCTRRADGTWNVEILCDLPYVHRFGLLKAPGGRCWLLACTIKSACEYKEDWRSPGKIYAALLPEKPEEFNKDHQLRLTVLMDKQYKNHGFSMAPDKNYALISTEEGVFRFTPPEKPDGEWGIHRLLEKPVSDITELDFDGDGKPELLTLSPFHGDKLAVFHLNESGDYEPDYQFPMEFPFLHAIWSGELNGEPCAVIGHRKGERDLLRVYYDRLTKEYRLERLDHDCGPANVLAYSDGGREFIVAANRETNEVALYSVEK